MHLIQVILEYTTSQRVRDSVDSDGVTLLDFLALTVVQRLIFYRVHLEIPILLDEKSIPVYLIHF